MRPARALLGLIGVGGVAALLAGLWLFAWLQSPAGGADAEAVVVEIPPGSSARDAAAILDREGVVDRPWLFTRLMTLAGVHRQLKSGEYRFELPIAPIEVMRVLHEGRVVTLPITVPEGMNLWEVAAELAASGIAGEQALLDAFHDASFVADFDPQAGNLEGYLFPETYRFARGSEASSVARELVDEFRSRFLEPYSAAIDSSGRSVRELVTLASLVEKETGLAEERGRIAGVFAERLERGMLLQADPTVIYAMRLEGRWDGNIRRADLQADHPYNTYRRSGLPPGPIASPGLPALLAALEPERTGELYFVATGDGGHEFSETLSEHNRNVYRYQKRRR